MTRIDRYVLREILGPTGLGLLLFTFVLLMNSFFLVAREVVEKDVTLSLVLRMVAYEMPRLVRWTLPMSVLLGALIGIGRMSAQSELVALRAAGVAFGRISRSVLLVGAVATGLGLVLTHLAVPEAIHAARGLRDEIVRARDLSREIRPRVFYADLPGAILYADEIERDGVSRVLRGVLLHLEDLASLLPGSAQRPEDPESGRRALVLAGRGHLANDRETGRITLQLEGVHQYVYDPLHPESLQEVPAGEAFFTFPPHPSFLAFSGAPRKGIEDATIEELRTRRRDILAVETDRSLSPGRRMRVDRIDFEIHARTAIPFASLVFALLGFALASVTRRGGRVSGFALSLFLIIVYWTLFSIGQDLGREGRVPPIAAAWTANLVLAAGAGVLLVVRRARGDQGLVALLSEGLRAWGGRRRRGRPAGPPARMAPAARLAESAGEVLDPAGARSWGPVLVDRYLVGFYVRALAYVGTFLVALYVVVEFTSMLEDVLKTTVPWALIVQYFLLFAPEMGRLALPVACLVATLVTVAVLSRHGEIVAMKAGGMSLGRIARPILSTTAVACLLFFLAQEYVLPVTNRNAEILLDRIEGRSSVLDDQEGRRWIFGAPERLVGYRDFLPVGRRLHGVSVLELAPDRLSLVRWVQAEQARVRAGAWRFTRGFVREFGPEQAYRPFDDLELALPEGPDLFGMREQLIRARSRLPERMELSELWTHIRDLRRSGYDTTSLLVGLYGKIAYPLTPLVMVLIGLPFAFRYGPRGGLYSVGVALALVIVYWAVYAVFQSLGREALLSPALAAGAPNLLFGLAGAYLFLSLRS